MRDYFKTILQALSSKIKGLSASIHLLDNRVSTLESTKHEQEPLTFTGFSNEVYDGKVATEVEIPKPKEWKLHRQITAAYSTTGFVCLAGYDNLDCKKLKIIVDRTGAPPGYTITYYLSSLYLTINGYEQYFSNCTHTMTGDEQLVITCELISGKTADLSACCYWLTTAEVVGQPGTIDSKVSGALVPTSDTSISSVMLHTIGQFEADTRVTVFIEE